MQKKHNFFSFELLILKILKEKDCYGYEITQCIAKTTNGDFDLRQGTLYPVLYKLIENKYISDYEDIKDRKVRVYYHLEPKGAEYLEELISNFHKGVSHVMRFLEGEIVYYEPNE